MVDLSPGRFILFVILFKDFSEVGSYSDNDIPRQVKL